MESTCPDDDATAADGERVQAAAAFAGDGSCIAEARRLATAFLNRVRNRHGVAVSARAMDVTQLVVSELITNARKYAPGPVLMDLRLAGDLIEVAVRDSGRRLPVVRPADPTRLGQHGLEIVTALVQSYEVTREAMGKRVTVRIALHDAS